MRASGAVSRDTAATPLRVPGRVWFDALVRQRFLLGPLWESRRADAFDQFCL